MNTTLALLSQRMNKQAHARMLVTGQNEKKKQAKNGLKQVRKKRKPLDKLMTLVDFVYHICLG